MINEAVVAKLMIDTISHILLEGWCHNNSKNTFVNW